MSEVKQTIGNYAKTLLAMLKGDETEALALHNERRAKSAIKRQISSLEDRQTSLEEVLENAEIKLKEAKYPITKLDESSSYCTNVIKYNKLVEEAKDNLSDCKASIAYFEDLKKELSL